MNLPFPEPTTPISTPTEVLLGYLDYYRSVLADRLLSLPEVELRRSRLPSGWTPLELLKHLNQVELRWLEWGFAASPVEDPWADERDGRWHVPAAETLAELLVAQRAQADRSRAIVLAHDLAAFGAPGPRWDGAAPATLERILLHLLQEYARHCGQLDIVVELAGGRTGE